MGVWGHENFDSDLALDYVGDLCKGIESEIDGFHFKSGLGIHELLNDAMPRIAVLSVLVEHCLKTGPQQQVVLEWKKRSLDIFDKQVSQLEADPDYVKKRRAAIVTTFDNLLRFADVSDSQ